MAEIQMTEENRPYLEALIRLAAGLPDDNAINTLTEAIVELMDLRALNTRMTPIIRDFARFGVGGFMPAYHVDEAVAIVAALDQMERVRDTLMGAQPRTIIEGDQQVGANGETFPVLVRERPEERVLPSKAVYGIQQGDPPINPDTLNEPEPPRLPDEARHSWESVESYHITTSFDEEGLPNLTKIRVVQCRICGAAWRHL